MDLELTARETLDEAIAGLSESNYLERLEKTYRGPGEETRGAARVAPARSCLRS